MLSALASLLLSADASRAAPGAWTSAGTLSVSHFGNPITTLKTGKVLVAGGNTSVSELFDPLTKTWSKTGSMVVQRTYATATLLWGSACDGASPPGYCGKVLVVGGAVGYPGFDVVPTNTAELYDPGSGTWTATTRPLMAPRLYHTATVLQDGRVLVTGGSTSYALEHFASNPPLVATTEIYDPSTDLWVPGPMLTHERAFHTATMLIGGRVLVAGGEDNTGSSRGDAEILDPSVVDPAWGTVAPMGTSRQAHVAVRLSNGEVLVAGGYRSTATGQGFLASAERFDPASGNWTPTAPMLDAPSRAAVVVLPGGNVLVAGPAFIESGLWRVDFEVYEPSTGRWTPTGRGVNTLAFWPGSQLALMDQQPCYDLCGRVLAAGGNSASSVIFDPTVTWPQPSISSIDQAGATACGDSTIVIHGSNFVGGGTVVAFGDTIVSGAGIVVDDSGTQITAHIPSHPPGTVHITVTTAGGDSAATVADLFTFPRQSGRWKPTGSLKLARHGATATLLGDGKVLVTGGTTIDSLWPANSGFATATAELYDPVTEKWSVTGLMGQARTHHTATLLPNGDVLVTGGRTTETVFNGTPGANVTLASAEVYSPLTGAWRATTPMLDARSEHTATLMHKGGQDVVLVAGGRLDLVTEVTPTRQARASAEVYDPVLGLWSPTGSMAVARFSGSASRLPDGRVLAVGGRRLVPRAADVGPGGLVPLSGPVSEVRDEALDSVEVYDPATGGWTGEPAALAARTDHSATTLGDGQVLVAGGRLGALSNATSSADLFSASAPAGSSPWQTAPLMALPRLRHTATPLSDGTVLVAGGAPQLQSFVPTAVPGAELYDPVSKSWLPAGCMSLGRVAHTATLLSGDTDTFHFNPAKCGANCGKVLVANGTDAVPDEADNSSPQRVALASAELYTPAPVVSGVSPPSGPVGGGTKVTLSGFGFTNNATAVNFGGTKIPVCPAVPAAPCFTVDSYTKLTLVSPPFAGGANPVDVTVTTDGGDSAPAPAARFAYGSRPVTDLAASVVEGVSGPPLVGLSWSAPDDGTGVSPAVGYVVKQSTTPITAENFDQATSLCAATAGACSAFTPAPSAVGQALGLSVSDLAPATTYYYALRPLEHDGGPGPLSNVASVTTPGSAIAGVVGDLSAVATSAGQVTLGFSAPPAYGEAPPPARDYVIKQSAAPITAENFDAATSLCEGRCHLAPTAVGEHLALVVDQLAGGTTYYYAMEALNPTTGAPGAMSNVASATTAGCAPAPTAGAGQVSYQAGYSMLGLTEGTVVRSDSPLYGWFDQGVGGAYSRQAPTEAVSGGRGYWAFFSCPRLVEISGAGTSALSVPQRAYHASMIGNPSATTAVKVSGYDFGALWDPTANAGTGGYKMSGYRQAATLPIGQALWTFSYSDTTVAIAP
ncbi:MAG TPA: kelch repeat-containing protein [Acidimicrobiales bacterium]|nr:kelch repeat-containing protein [Acidimicrobiales bacterium]